LFHVEVSQKYIENGEVMEGRGSCENVQSPSKHLRAFESDENKRRTSSETVPEGCYYGHSLGGSKKGESNGSDGGKRSLKSLLRTCEHARGTK